MSTITTTKGNIMTTTYVPATPEEVAEIKARWEAQDIAYELDVEARAAEAHAYNARQWSRWYANESK
jgi:hypothetical protein